MAEYEAVVLAGGQGSRMGRLGEQYAKALLPVGNEPLICASPETAGVGLVSGTRGWWWVIVAAIWCRWWATARAMDCTSRSSSRVNHWAVRIALGRVRPYVQGPMLVVLGDYFFVPREPERMLKRLEKGVPRLGTCESRTLR